MIQLVGFCGPIGAGKTTAARQIAPLGFERVRFAEPLKRMMRALGLSEAEVDGADKERPCALLGGETPRWAMQSLGTEWGRQCIGVNFWVNAWARIVDDKLAAGALVVADDVRFSNEVRAIRERGGRVIRIERPGVAAGAHASEQMARELCDIVVVNDADEAQLSRRVAAAMLSLGEDFGVSAG